MSNKQDAYWMQQNVGAGSFDEKDELLHPEARQYEPDETMTESQYFGLCMPEEGIHGALNLYHYPNISQVTGGVWVFQGFKPHHLASEIFDWRNHMSDKVLANDLHDYTLINGYRMRIIEPGKKFHAHYLDEQRKNGFDIEYTAIMPPHVFSSNKHFDQHMKTEGELVLRGRKFQVSGYTIRDRSWGQARTEANLPLTPMTYCSGVFNDNFSFCCQVYDDPLDHPEWDGKLAPPTGKVFSGGFVRNNGETLDLVDGSKRMVRNPETLRPECIELNLVDSRGNSYQITGAIVAASHFSMWYNMTTSLCQTRWECNGLTGYGDVQDVLWGDLVFQQMKR